MIIKRIADVQAKVVDAEGAEKTQVRVVFGPHEGAPNFALRQFELEAGGCTPHHSHPFEHEIVVMEGQLTAVTEQGEIPVSMGDAMMVLPGERHQFRNTSSGPAKMLCLIPVEYQK